MKFTLFVTHECNLRCDYCYIAKHPREMTAEVARKAVEFAYRTTPADEKIEFGFFGGEPLLRPDFIATVADLVVGHPDHDPSRVEMTLVTNGTRFDDDVEALVRRYAIGFGVSCDGPPDVQDTFRRHADGRGSGEAVERTLRAIAERLPYPMVNAVFHPRTVARLPDVVAWFRSLGLRHIYLAPDFSAAWTAADGEALAAAYGAIGRQYVEAHLAGDPCFISPIDTKIALLLRGGYEASERCRMGRGEFAFTADGHIYPCERLVGPGDGGEHCIGHLDTGIDLSRIACGYAEGAETNDECLDCGLREHCMYWCGCSNAAATGSYNRVSPFLCASERAANQVAFEAYEILGERLGPVFCEHLAGDPSVHILGRRQRGQERSAGGTNQPTREQARVEGGSEPWSTCTK